MHQLNGVTFTGSLSLLNTGSQQSECILSDSKLSEVTERELRSCFYSRTNVRENGKFNKGKMIKPAASVS